jgi:endogenous inhibitor of DNA gyrase (YacG/DUF329 family)
MSLEKLGQQPNTVFIQNMDGREFLNSVLATRFCPICNISIDHKNKNAKFCSRKCSGKAVGLSKVASITKTAEERSEIALRAIKTRRENGAEEGRILAVKKSHKNGNYKEAYNALYEDTITRSSERRKEIADKAAVTNRELGYLWMMGKNNPMNSMSQDSAEKRKKGFCQSMRKYWDDPNWVTAHLEKAGRSPNKFERTLTEFMQTNNLPFRFTGDWGFWVGKPCQSGISRNPDFVYVGDQKENWKKFANQMKMGILAHGMYWHSNQEGVKMELEDYRLEGWEICIIWENENLDEKLIRKIKRFVGL